MADVTKLKPKTAKESGPPPEAQAPRNIDNPPRDKKEPIQKLQLSLPESLLSEFEAEAARRFGFKKGSKSTMFAALWEHYKRTNGG